ncbi:MAG: alkanesulfonate monooxygenase SsuD [Halieaceae bacterium]|jgi:alkanesulfonate monooxygenase SsuD/methylene tetrahydromethanopterin reductase-like flavin-dependent oxidoreductase (luciferase family)
MKFAYHATMCPADHYEPLAIAAEDAGFDTFTFPDSICYPQEGSDVYPYNDDGSRDFLDGVPFVEPFVIIPYLAGITRKLRFTTTVYKLAVHQPVGVAKQLSSLAIMTNNRFGFGVGISPWPEDFMAMQIPWENRGKRMNEMMEIVNGLMSGEYFGYDGEIFQIDPIKLCPVPTIKVPLLVGGHAKPALRRAARLGDGWVSAGSSYEELKAMIEEVDGLRCKYQRDHLPFENHAMTAEAYTVEGLRKLESIGVTEVVIAFRNPYDGEPDTQNIDERIAMINWYAENVMEPYRSESA